MQYSRLPSCSPTEDTLSADVVVTGEEFVALELRERLLAHRRRNEHPRQTFHRLRRGGGLHDIAGLVYREGDENEPHGRLINTGTQRLVRNLDELPHPLVGLGLIEPPHRRRTLAPQPLALHQLRHHARVIAVVTTHGCKFHCPYCPIPAYNQFTFRYKSPEQLRDELQGMAERTGVRTYFGTDDNLFNDRATVATTFATLARGTVHGQPFRDALFFGTEATAHDVHKNLDLLPLCRAGGLRAIWFGIEDLRAVLVKKGQSPEKTQTVFHILRSHGICPMPMMMHHDDQPLTSPDGLSGLLNQVRFLRRSGAVSMQVTMLTPMVGSKGYEDNFHQGKVIRQAGTQKVEDYHFDGNHCIATKDRYPWRRQLNIYLAYASFYNPLNLLRAALSWRDPNWGDRILLQVFGMAGLVKSIVKSWHWFSHLCSGPIRRFSAARRPRLVMLSPQEVIESGK
jgi:radical SAM superfamily enzyme YgiQ (UPF0313 family)